MNIFSTIQFCKRTGFVVVMSLCFATSVHAQSLTDSQVNAILSLLRSFGVEEIVISDVSRALAGETIQPRTNVFASVNIVDLPSQGIWYLQRSKTIVWREDAFVSDTVDIFLCKEGGSCWEYETNEENDGRYSLFINDDRSTGENYYVKIREAGLESTAQRSARDFELQIYQAHIKVGDLSGGNKWIRGERQTVTWDKLAFESTNIEVLICNPETCWNLGEEPNDGATVVYMNHSKPKGRGYYIKIQHSNKRFISQKSSTFEVVSLEDL